MKFRHPGSGCLCSSGQRVQAVLFRLEAWVAVMAWIFVLSGAFPAYAGWLPDPVMGDVVLNSGSYTIEGKEVRITVEIARVNGWDGPARVEITAAGCTVLPISENKEKGGATQVTWANTERETKTVVLVAPREEFFAVKGKIEVALANPKGAQLGETISLVAMPKGGDVEADEGIRVADGKGKRLFLEVEDTAPSFPASTPEQAVADASAPNDEHPAL